MTIDDTTLCAHLKAVLRPFVSERDITVAVGFLKSLEPAQFKKVATDIATLMTALILHRDPVLEDMPSLPLSLKDGKVTCRWPWLQAVVNIEGQEGLFVHSALSNLKSSLVIEDLSRDERKAARRSICHATAVPSEFYLEWVDFLKKAVPTLISTMDLKEKVLVPMWAQPYSTTGTTVFSGRSVKRVDRGSIESLDYLSQMRHPAINRLIRTYPEHFVKNCITGYTMDPSTILLAVPLPGDCTLIGRIAIAPKISEKARVVFVPLMILDSMSRSLGSTLWTLIAQWSLQGCMSHDDSRSWCQVKLRLTDDVIYSFDHSSFTDNLEYDHIQRPVLVELRRLGVISHFDVELNDIIVRGQWDARVLRSDPIAFGTGTPMGTYPSFPLASLTNGMLVYFAYYQTYGRLPEHLEGHEIAQVVGDDVVIFDSRVAERYISLCDVCGLTLNKDKTIRSNDVIEFCGKFITSGSICDKHKLRPNDSTGAIVHTADYYGHMATADRFFHEIGSTYPQVEQTYKALKRFPRPYGLAQEIDPDAESNSLSWIQLAIRTSQEVRAVRRLNPVLRSKSTWKHVFSMSRRDVQTLMIRKDLIPTWAGTAIREDDATPERLTFIENLIAQMIWDTWLSIRNHWQDCETTRQSYDTIHQNFLVLRDTFNTFNRVKEAVDLISPNEGRPVDLHALNVLLDPCDQVVDLAKIDIDPTPTL